MQLFPESSMKILDHLSGIDGATVLEKHGIDYSLTVVMREGNEVIVGRSVPTQATHAERRIWLNNPAISRSHCVLGMDHNGTYVKDIGTGPDGSKNGTFVNDKRLDPGEKIYVSQCDRITLGKPLRPFAVAITLVVKKRVARLGLSLLPGLKSKLAVPAAM